MDTRASRRRILGAVGGVAGLALVGGLSGAAQNETGTTTDEYGEYWTVTPDTADVTVTSDTDDDVQSDGDVYVTGTATSWRAMWRRPTPPPTRAAPS